MNSVTDTGDSRKSTLFAEARMDWLRVVLLFLNISLKYTLFKVKLPRTSHSYLHLQNLRTVVAVLDEACAALPPTQTLLQNKGIDEKLLKTVEECRQRSETQKRVLDREMEVWQIVDEQKMTEKSRKVQGHAATTNVDSNDSGVVGFYSKRRDNQKSASVATEVDMGEEKPLQRGSVGSDRGG